MENSKGSAEEVSTGSTSSCQRLRRQEGATRDASIVLEQRADSARPLGLPIASTHHQLPCHQRRWIDNDDLFAAIDRHGQGLAECLSLAKSTLAMVRCRSPPEADSVEDRLARAKARITGETFVIIFAFLQSHPQDSDYLSFAFFRFVCPIREPSIGCGARGGIRQRQRCHPGGLSV